MNILALNDTKSSSTFETRKKAIYAIIKLGWSYSKACGYYHASRTSIYRWVKKYRSNPCDESISLLSHKPKTPHPNSYSDYFIQKVLNKHKRCPKKTKFDIWCDFQSSDDDFKPSYMTILRIFRRNNADFQYKTNKKKKHNKPYDTPKTPGEKWQVDVKYVPKECKTSDLDGRFYQYTILDEFSRKRFLYFTNEHSMYETVKSLKEAITFFGYSPNQIQTDNGFEFNDKARRKDKGTNIRQYENLLEKFCSENNIKHHFIRPRTPEHNGKVERSHRIDQEQFYRYLKFFSLADLKAQGKKRMEKYNNKPRFLLGFKSPNQKELEGFRTVYQNTGEIRCMKCFTSIVN